MRPTTWLACCSRSPAPPAGGTSRTPTRSGNWSARNSSAASWSAETLLTMRRNRHTVSYVTLLEVGSPASPVPASGSRERRIADAALRCFARWGVAKTTLDDVAREAGCSRATVYRFFPGGKDALVGTVACAEIAAFVDAIRRRLDAARNG